MPKTFSSFLSGFNEISKKKSSHWRRHLFLRFYVDLQKKKVLPLTSASFLRDLCDIPGEASWTTAVYGFWQEKKRQKSQNFSAKMPKKILQFFALIGNTAYYCKKMPQNYSAIKTSYFSYCTFCLQTNSGQQPVILLLLQYRIAIN